MTTPPPPPLTPDELRRAASLNRLHMRLDGAQHNVAEMEERLNAVPVGRRKAGWEDIVSTVLAQRDEAQAALDEAYRKLPGNAGFSTGILVEVLRARLKHWGTLDWVATVERLGGPKAGAVLAQMKEIERVGVGGDQSLSGDCPVVLAMQTQDANPAAFKMKPKRRAPKVTVGQLGPRPE